MKHKRAAACSAGLLFTGFLFFFSAPSQAQSGPASIFQADCAECHGADGGANTAMGRSLKMRDLRSPEVQKRTNAELTDIITNGMATMHPWKDKLTKDQIHEMVAYIRQLAGPVKLDIVDGSSASYRVQEQLAGIGFPSDAVGTTSAVTGTLVLNADGSVNSDASKLTIDLRTLKSDQDMRDGYIQKRTLETDKFPTAEFVPRSIMGIPNPFPAKGQAGFQLTGDLTIHGVTSPVTWMGIVTFNDDGAAGRGTTSFTFATFGLTKPTLARLLSVADKIQLEVAFKFKRS